MKTRRAFIGETSLLAAVACIIPSTAPAWLGQDSLRPLDHLSFSDFAAQLHSTFDATHPASSNVPLTLVRAEQKKASAKVSPKALDRTYEKFKLVFRGPLQTPLDQGQYCFTHPNLGKFELFIVPILSQQTRHVCYEAIFNRPQLQST